MRDDFDPVAYVVSHNLHRRHLTESQRAAVAAKIKKQLAGPAKERKREGGKAGGKIAGNGRQKKSSQSRDALNLPQPKNRNGRAREQAAEMLNVSPSSVAHATTVLDHGSPELIDALEQGKHYGFHSTNLLAGMLAEECDLLKHEPLRAIADRPMTEAYRLRGEWELAEATKVYDHFHRSQQGVKERQELSEHAEKQTQ